MSASALVDTTLSTEVLITGVETDCDCLCLGGGKASKLRRRREQGTEVGGAEGSSVDVATYPQSLSNRQTDRQTASVTGLGRVKSLLTPSLSPPAASTAASLSLQRSSESVLLLQRQEDAPQESMNKSAVMPGNVAANLTNAQAAVGMDSTATNTTTTGYLFDLLTSSDLDAFFDSILDAPSGMAFDPNSDKTSDPTVRTSTQTCAGFDTAIFSAGIATSSPAPPSSAVPPANVVDTSKPGNAAFGASHTSLSVSSGLNFADLDAEKDSAASVNRTVFCANNFSSASTAHRPSLASPPLVAAPTSFGPAPSLPSPTNTASAALVSSQLQQQSSFSPQLQHHPAKSTTFSRSLSQPVGLGAMTVPPTTISTTTTDIFHGVQQSTSGVMNTAALPEPATQIQHLLTAAQTQVVPQLRTGVGSLNPNGSLEPSSMDTLSLPSTSSSKSSLCLSGHSVSSSSQSFSVPGHNPPSLTVSTNSIVGGGTSPTYHMQLQQNGFTPSMRHGGDLRPHLLRTLSEPSSSSSSSGGGAGNGRDVLEADERLARKLQEEEFVKGMRRSTHSDERLAMDLLAKDLAVRPKRNGDFETPMATTSTQSIQPPLTNSVNVGLTMSACASTDATSSTASSTMETALTGESTNQQPPPSQEQGKKAVDWGSPKYPKCWSKCPSDSDETYHLVEVEHGSPEWHTVSRPLLETGFNVTSVRRIENETLWQRLCFEKQQMLKVRAHCNERFLYHTSRAELSVICEEGLDPRLSQNGLFGTGIYFSDNPIKCDKYWAARHIRERTMFCCRVLLGETKVYPKGRNERLKREPKAYDSVKGNMTGQDEYVVYNAYRVMPEYVLNYYTSEPFQPQPHVCRFVHQSLAQRRMYRRVCAQFPYYYPGMLHFPPNRTQMPPLGGHNGHLCPHSAAFRLS